MKLITGGVGVSHISNTPTGLRVYVNKEFAAKFGGAPGSKLLAIRRIVRQPDGWDIHLGDGPDGVKTSSNLDGSNPHISFGWNGRRPQPPGLPIGGKTPILRLREQDECVVVTMPSELIPSGKIGAQARAKEKRQKEQAEVGTNAPPTCGVAELQDAIRVVNTCIESMGDTLVLSLEGEPRRLRAMIELG